MNNRYIDIIKEKNNLTYEECKELIEYYLQEYKDIHNLESLQELTQMQFHAALMYVFQHAFYRKESVKYQSKTVLDYNDSELLYNLCMYYIYNIALENNKIVSVYHYSALTGIDRETIKDWNINSKSDIYKVAIYKNLFEIREQTLTDKLISDNYKSPVATIAVLNREYNWNQYGSVIVNQNQISSADLNSISSRYNSGSLEDKTGNNPDSMQNMATLPDNEYQDNDID